MFYYSSFCSVSSAQQKELEQIQKDIDSLKATNANKVKQKEEKNERLKENEDLFKQKTEGLLFRIILNNSLIFPTIYSILLKNIIYFECIFLLSIFAEVTSKESNVNKQLEKLEKGLKYFEEYLGLKVYTSPGLFFCSLPCIWLTSST